MRFCADTWFLLKICEKDKKALEIIRNLRHKEDILIIPYITLAELYKKLSQVGVSMIKIDEFIDSLEASEKIEFIAIDREIARRAAKISLSFPAPLIDSVILAIAMLTNCNVIITKDAHFKKAKLKLINW